MRVLALIIGLGLGMHSSQHRIFHLEQRIDKLEAQIFTTKDEWDKYNRKIIRELNRLRRNQEVQ